jgi:Phosphoenolpyruvate carboxykinase
MVIATLERCDTRLPVACALVVQQQCGVGQCPADTSVPGVTSTTSVAIDVSRGQMVILGTEYAGEMKKGIFSVMHYLMPLAGHLTLHSGCNMGADKDVSLFFGLSGTGLLSGLVHIVPLQDFNMVFERQLNLPAFQIPRDGTTHALIWCTRGYQVVAPSVRALVSCLHRFCKLLTQTVDENCSLIAAVSQQPPMHQSVLLTPMLMRLLHMPVL